MVNNKLNDDCKAFLSKLNNNERAHLLNDVSPFIDALIETNRVTLHIKHEIDRLIYDRSLPKSKEERNQEITSRQSINTFMKSHAEARIKDRTIPSLVDTARINGLLPKFQPKVTTRGNELKDNDAWNQLTPEEQTIIMTKIFRDDGESYQQAFNRIIDPGTPEDISNKIIIVKNFIESAGGYRNDAIWQQVKSIYGVQLDNNPDYQNNYGQPEPQHRQGGVVKVTVTDQDKFLEMISQRDNVMSSVDNP